MKLQECYEKIGGDYEGVKVRLMNERIVQKFLLKFLNDGSYRALMEAMDSKNYEEAFRAAHTMKGVCQNLGITRLGDSSSRMTEALRRGREEEYLPLLELVKEDYQQTVSAILEFQAGIGGC